MPPAGAGQRAAHQPEDGAPTHSGGPVHDVVGEPGPLRRQLAVKSPLNEAPAEPGRGRGIVPIVETGRGFPIHETAASAATPVSGVPEQIHRGGADRTGQRAADNRADRGHADTPDNLPQPTATG